MGTFSQIAKIAKSHLPSEKRKRRTQKAKAAGIASFRDTQLSKALKAGKVTKPQQKAVDRHRGKPGGAPKKKAAAPPPQGTIPKLKTKDEKYTEALDAAFGR